MRAGDTLVLDSPAVNAIIQPDGRLIANGVVGSIHRVGATLKQVPSCNGWLHWQYLDMQTGEWLVLDELRHQWRRTNNQSGINPVDVDVSPPVPRA